MRLYRLVGAVTAVYSAALVVGPKLLIRPGGMDRTPSSAMAVRAIGVRDTAIGVAMMSCRSKSAIATVGMCRAVADAGDAGIFGRSLSSESKWKIGGFAAAWSALSAVATVTALRD
ncbi:MAG TPA: hypothetical protein VGJ28_10560 [Micromonosporaceae bacterium]|jgi:hypothetical protein